MVVLGSRKVSYPIWNDCIIVNFSIIFSHCVQQLKCIEIASRESIFFCKTSLLLMSSSRNCCSSPWIACRNSSGLRCTPALRDPRESVAGMVATRGKTRMNQVVFPDNFLIGLHMRSYWDNWLIRFADMDPEWIPLVCWMSASSISLILLQLLGS